MYILLLSLITQENVSTQNQDGIIIYYSCSFKSYHTGECVNTKSSPVLHKPQQYCMQVCISQVHMIAGMGYTRTAVEVTN